MNFVDIINRYYCYS